MKDMRILTTTEILNLYPKITCNNQEKWYSLLQQAKNQFGNTLEKIEMVMQYQKFTSEDQETECFAYLMSNL